jgi:putative peptidoglycan lipid II flippase
VSETTSVARSAAGMGIATALSRSIGFLRVLGIAAILGTTYLGNTFTSSNYVSNVLFELLAAGALSAVLVPTMVEVLDRGDNREAERVAGAVLGRALLVLGVVTVIGMIAAPQIARLLTAGVDNEAIAEQQQELATFLLRFFVPQVLLYAVGTVSIAVMYAKRRLVVPALAPIANTIVIVAGLVVFRLLAGPDPGLDLTTAEQLVLALSGTLGVAALVAVPSIGLWRTGFRLRPRLTRRDPAVSRLMRLSGWAILFHAQIGLLLGAAIILGNSVRGGTVAYQVAWVFFLAPYSVLALPILTAILPDLTRDANSGRLDGFARSLRWATGAIGMLVLPVSAAMVALAKPGMSVVAFGEASENGVGLLSAGIASLAIGLLAYSMFQMLARAYYTLDDSRTPALTALGAAIVGVAFMATVAPFVHGTARVAVLGLGHSVAYFTGAIVLTIGLSRRTGRFFIPAVILRMIGLAVAIGTLMWWVAWLIDPSSRLGNLVLVVVSVVVGGAAYLGGLRITGAWVQRKRDIPVAVEELEPDSAEVDA